jgi:ParB-like chromosome segregation protein Spo0J
VIEQSIPIERLKERDDPNPNVMPEEDFERLVRAVDEQGFLQPVLAREVTHGGGRVDLEIIDGVHRTRAARRAGLTEIPVVLIDADDERARVLRLAMNKLRGELDLSRVAEELAALAGAGWDVEALTATGYGEEALNDLLRAGADVGDDELLAAAGSGIEDERPPATEDGGVYLLEVHCADAKELRAFKRKLRRMGDGDLAAGLRKALDDV